MPTVLKRVLVIMVFIIVPLSVQSKKIKFSFSRNARPSLKEHFITDVSVASRARKISNRIIYNQRVHFYYKVGPLKCIARKGAPFRTRLLIKHRGHIKKDFGWQRSNAASKAQMRKNQIFKWYHNCAWNFVFRSSTRTGTYQVELQHHDLNSNRTITARYSLVLVKGNTESTDSGETHRSGGNRTYHDIGYGNFRLGMDYQSCEREIKRVFLAQGGDFARDHIKNERIYMSRIDGPVYRSLTATKKPKYITSFFSRKYNRCFYIRTDLFHFSGREKKSDLIKKALRQMQSLYGKHSSTVGYGNHKIYVWYRYDKRNQVRMSPDYIVGMYYHTYGKSGYLAICWYDVTQCGRLRKSKVKLGVDLYFQELYKRYPVSE